MARIVILGAGVGLQAFDKTGEDITDKMFAPNALMKVDGDYSPRSYDQWLRQSDTYCFNVGNGCCLCRFHRYAYF